MVVTRPRDGGERLAIALAGRGARPVLFPTIEIHPVADPTAVDMELHRLDSFDWLIFTSANAVTHTWARVQALGVRLPAAIRVAAVGPATAGALDALGIQVSAVPTVYQGEALPAALGSLAGLRILLPRADIGREETARVLRDAGAKVVDRTVYNTVPAAPDETGLAELRAGVDAVTFTSPSTVRNFDALLGREAQTVLSRTVLACIGPTTADALRQCRFGTPLLAAQATADGLVDLLDGYFARIAAEAEGAHP